MKETRIPNTALQWTPQGQCKPGRPELTWMSTIMKELNEMGMTLGEGRNNRKKKPNDLLTVNKANCWIEEKIGEKI
ncbi:zinc transporter 8 [Brachionus plicatilis]|uniref:Zinc transporter 8 n=1 Tax=Brachionus plicatilis TaxID=10195 RepID=A0A3M7P631_BRAPC|nr:zinc transporter 8 [Brachionus plicatilis]